MPRLLTIIVFNTKSGSHTVLIPQIGFTLVIVSNFISIISYLAYARLISILGVSIKIDKAY